MKKVVPSGEILMSCGMLIAPRLSLPITACVSVEIFRAVPENSQVTTKNRPFPEKSAWLGPSSCGPAGWLDA